jgi:hypothetical protein
MGMLDDMFGDNSTFVQNILGINPAAAKPAPQGTLMPQPQQPPGPSPQTLAMTNAPMDTAQAPPSANTMGMSNAGGSPVSPNLAFQAQLNPQIATPQNPIPPNGGQGPAPPSGFPPSAPPPVQLNQGPPGSNISGGLIGGLPPPNGAIPPPPPSTGQGPVTSTTGNGLAGALGLNNDQWRAKMAGLGRGLSAVGNIRPGTPAVAALAAGAGGTLTGQNQAQDTQIAQARAKQNDAFSQDLQTKNYDISKLKAAISTKMMNEKIPFWQTRTDVLKTKAAQDASSKAWQMSEPGKYHTAETEIQQHEKGLLALYRDEIKDATLSGDKERLDKVRKVVQDGVEDFRQKTYKKYSLDPKKAEDAAKKGFVGTEDQIKHLPPGTPFWDPKSGTTLKRKKDQFSEPVTGEQNALAMPGQNEQVGAGAEQ